MRGHMHCLYTFLKSVHTGQQLGPSLEDGVKMQEILAKVQESAANGGKWVKI